MVPNVTQITSKLATLNDQQLQQYAQMHQEDAYVLALAVSEKNRRAALRNSAQAQQAPQGTVAEQEVAEMAPAGISTLEAPAIDELGMADGGVVGYAGGGEASGFVQDIKAIPDTYEAWWQKNREEDLRKQAEEEAAAQRRAAREEASRKASFFNYMFGTPSNEREGLAALQNLNQPPVPDTGDETARLLGRYPAPTTPPTTPPATTPPAPPAAGKVPPTPDQSGLMVDGVGAGRVPAVPVAQAPVAGGLADLRTMLSEASDKRDAALKQQSNDLAAFYAASEQDIKAEQEELKARSKDQDKPFDEKRERVSERQKELDAQRKQARSMALIVAGINMLAGESPNAFVNIARGAQAGLDYFAADTQRIDKAREGLREELDRIAELHMQMRSATGEKLAQLRKEERQLRREGAFKVKEILTAAGAKDADAMYQRVANGLVDATIKEITAEADLKRQMRLKQFDRETAFGQARIAAGGRSGSPDATRMKEIADLQAKVYDVLSKNPLFLSMPPEQQKKMFDQQMQMLLEGNAGLGEGMFLPAPANGAQVRRSSAMAQ